MSENEFLERLNGYAMGVREEESSRRELEILMLPHRRKHPSLWKNWKRY
jgi:hypothetical protein